MTMTMTMVMAMAGTGTGHRMHDQEQPTTGDGSNRQQEQQHVICQWGVANGHTEEEHEAKQTQRLKDRQKQQTLLLQIISNAANDNNNKRKQSKDPSDLQADMKLCCLSVCLPVCGVCVCVLHGNRLQRRGTLTGLTLSECCLLVMGENRQL